MSLVNVVWLCLRLFAFFFERFRPHEIVKSDPLKVIPVLT